MGIFNGILLCTDLDGTLLRNDHTISEENKAAIEYFKSEGGKFTFITGRMPSYVSDIYRVVEPNVPFGCVNGGGLYDHVAQKYIWTQELPATVASLLQCVADALPNVGIQFNTFYKTYFCKENLTMEKFRQTTHLPNLIGDYHKITEPLAKIIFGSEDNDEILAIERLLNAHPLAKDFAFIRSSRSLFEILPKGIGKGSAITQLVKYLKQDSSKTVAIGDYNNDISMFHAVKIGIAVANACQDALDAADFVTVSNEEHAVARVIYDLEKGKYHL